jgi:ketosteroid isomerase-like protein
MRRALALLLALGLGGCGLLPWGGGRSGLDAEADRLLAEDRAYAARAAEAGTAAASREFYDPNGVRLSGAAGPATGLDAVQASFALGPSRVLSWEPRYAEVFAPGHTGWTWGDWQAHEPGAGGRRVAQGRYLSVWKKQPDGSWKVRGDLGGTIAEK